MRKRCLFLLPFLLCVFGRVAFMQTATAPVSVPAASGAVPAGAPGAAFSGLDVVILIDQSGSMWRFPQNDKYNHRIGQTKNLIYRLAEHVENTPFVHRVSVVNFGDKAEVALSNHIIRFDPADPGGALRTTKAVVERAVTNKDWRNTNIPEALQRALDELAKMDAAEHRPGQNRVLLLLTDGRPDVPGTSLPTLQNQIDAHAVALRAQNAGLWVVGLNDDSNYWNSGDGAFWEKVAGSGRARLAETASSKIASLMQDIADEWLGAKSSPFKNGEYECPPYLRRIVFSINMAVPRSAVGVADPAGNDIPLAAGGPGVSPGTFARFVVEDPPPGIYKLKRDPTRSYTPKVEEFSPVIKRLSPAAATGMELPTRIVFQALNSQGKPLEPLAEYPITPSITIAPPNGSASEIEAKALGEGKYAAQWQAPQLGVYQVRLKGMVTLKSGATYDVFGANASSYDERLEVSSLHAYMLAFDEPNPTDGFRVWRADSIQPLAFYLVDAKGAPVDNPASLVKDPATWLSLRLVDAAGVALSGAAQPLALASDGKFRTTLPVKLNWWRGEGWWTPGRVSLQVVAQPNRVQAGSYLDSIHLPVAAEDLRMGGDPLTVGPLKQRFSRWILWPLALVALLLLLGIVLVLTRRLLPRILISVADRVKRRTVVVKVFNGDNDPEGDYAKKLNATGGYQFKYDRNVTVTVDGTDYIATEFRLRRLPSFNRVEVEVQYRWQHEPKPVYRARLRKGRVERLKGLPQAEYAISLEENS